MTCLPQLMWGFLGHARLRGKLGSSPQHRLFLSALLSSALLDRQHTPGTHFSHSEDGRRTPHPCSKTPRSFCGVLLFGSGSQLGWFANSSNSCGAWATKADLAARRGKNHLVTGVTSALAQITMLIASCLYSCLASPRSAVVSGAHIHHCGVSD